MSLFTLRHLLAGAAVPFVTSAARANDGGISWGGSPTLLGGHPHVAMQSEVVKISVGQSDAVVDCRFVFVNSGPATTARMGFPDEGTGERGFYAGNEEWSKVRVTPALSNFKWFKSWVDGQATPTTLEKGREAGRVWHAKAVRFAAGQKRVVRDLYAVPLGSQIVRDGIYRQTAYTLHTGASWKGNIGRSEVLVTFARPLGGQLRAIPFAKVPTVGKGDDKDEVFGAVMKPGVAVVSGGPGMPTTSGRTLRWVRTNWRPTKKDDVFVLFDFQSHKNLGSRPAAKPNPLLYLDTYPVRRRLTFADVDGVSPDEMRLMRNAIYARHGRPFSDPKLKSEFQKRAWYKPRGAWDGADEAKMSALDRENAAFLLSLQAR